MNALRLVIGTLSHGREPANKLLLIDDEQDIKRIMKIGLEKAGYSVDVYNDPKTALDNFKPDYYDRIIADIRMPSMSWPAKSGLLTLMLTFAF